MYHQHFGLKEAPFSIAPNPRYLFMSRRHKEALAHLIYGVSHGGGFVLLTGEVGTGKTTISRCLLKQLPKSTDIAYILNPYLDSTELLASICDELKVDNVKDTTSLKELSDRLHSFLLENHAKGRNTVLIIDEAQHLGFKVMEQIRLLTNLETDEKKLLQIIFIGQPELNDILAKDELRQLAQRITARFHIEPLSAAETKAYIRHRLMIAGMSANQTLFNQAAIKVIYNHCKGIPRLINVACDRALLGAYTNNLLRVDKDVAYAAVMESSGKKAIAAPGTKAPLMISAALAVTIAIMLIWIGVGKFKQKPPPAIVIANPQENAGVIQRNHSLPPPTFEVKPDDLSLINSGISPAELTTMGTTQIDDAINRLQQELGIFSGNLNPACDRLVFYGVDCLSSESNSWSDFTSYNRPAVLELEINNQTLYLSVSGISNNDLIVHTNNDTVQIPKFELGQYWTGKFTVLWQPPESFKSLAKRGDRSSFITWIADSFATIDNQPEPLTDALFNQALEQRVAVFQQEAGLDPDGIVGIKTVLKINDYLNNDFSLNINNLNLNNEVTN